MLRPATEAKWRNLVDVIPVWKSRVRHPAQFWPQFHALVREMEMECDPQEAVELDARVKELVKEIQDSLP